MKNMEKVISFMLISFCLSGLVYATERDEALIFAKNYENEIKQSRARRGMIQEKARRDISREIDDLMLEMESPFKKHAWQLGTEVYYFRYREPDVMRETGMMYGLAGSYSYHNNFMLKAEGRGAWCKVDYKNSGAINDINDYTVELRGLGGYDFKTSQDLIFTPYFGIGYRYLNDDTSGKTSSTGAAGYKRESNYLYSPVGVEGAFRLKEGWSLGACAEYDIFWRGWQKSRFSDVDADFSDLDNTQKKGYGVRGSIKLRKEGEKLNFLIEPFIRYWNIGKSEDSDVTYSGVIVGYGYEPKNNTTECGVKLGVDF